MPNLVLGGGGVVSAYDIDNSLRFNEADSAYLSRTPSVAGNRKTWTISFWVKKSKLDDGDHNGILSVYGAGDNTGFISLEFTKSTTTPSDAFRVSAWSTSFLITTQVFRDPSAWYHFVVACDTTDITANDRLKIYVNGVEITSFGTRSNPGENDDTAINMTSAHHIGENLEQNDHLGGYLAEFYLIDGTKYAASDFGELSSTTNQWIPKNASGLTFGTNGFYLKFQDSAALGDDSSGNTNDFTVTNLVATDQMIDTPTNNFCTMNPLDSQANVTFEEGNLQVNTGSNNGGCRGTIFTHPTGKWYWEFYMEDSSAGGSLGAGGPDGVIAGAGVAADSYGYWGTDGYKINNNSQSSYGATYAAGDIIGVAVDLDASPGTITFYKNNATQGVAYSNLTDGNVYAPATGDQSASTSIIILNAGQDSSFAGNKTAQGNQDSNDVGDFYYEPPANHLALCTDNLSDPDIALPGDYFNPVLYTGDGSDDHNITGVGFQPDWTWIKCRSNADSHALYDAVRGATKFLMSNSTSAEQTETDALVSFDSDGFTLDDDATGSRVNVNTRTYASWNWKGGGTGVTNEDGDITSTVSANTTSGFSIVKYTGDDTAGSTVGHGLSVIPELLIWKNLDITENFGVFNSYVCTVNSADRLYLNTTSALVTSGADRIDALSASLVTFGSNNSEINNTDDFIMYCFHSVEGYSKVGSFEGNENTVGPFIYTGFKPALVIMKSADQAATNWNMEDNKRDSYNVVDHYLAPSSNAAESTSYNFGDFLSNGFKVRQSDVTWNDSGTMIYIAFAESPFKYSNAR